MPAILHSKPIVSEMSIPRLSARVTGDYHTGARCLSRAPIMKKYNFRVTRRCLTLSQALYQILDITGQQIGKSHPRTKYLSMFALIPVFPTWEPIQRIYKKNKCKQLLSWINVA